MKQRAYLQPKLGYRLLMGISLLELTQLSATTAVLSLLVTMVLLGFGFGLSCLAIVSAVQFIPVTKAGIASGMVNASRQLGTCLGIAILVGTMTATTATAKKQIRHASNVQMTRLAFPDMLQHVIQRDLNSALRQSTSNQFQSKMRRDIASSWPAFEKPGTVQNVNLRRLYVGT